MPAMAIRKAISAQRARIIALYILALLVAAAIRRYGEKKKASAAMV